MPSASQGRRKWGEAASRRASDGPLGHLGQKLETLGPVGHRVGWASVMGWTNGLSEPMWPSVTTVQKKGLPIKS